MDESNLYPLDGKAFMTEPEEQLNERKLETAQAQAAGPMLEEIIARFAARVTETDSILRALEVAEAYKATHKEAMIGLNIARNEFELEKNWLEGLLEDQR